MPAPEQRAEWVGSAANPWLILTGVAAAAATALLSGTTSRPVAIVTAILAVTVLGLSVVRVGVGPDGMRVSYGPWRWPRTTLPVREIRDVQAVDVRPLHWGGWGYRGSRRLARRAAVVVRKGRAIRVDLTDGTSLAVTVDDADTGAARLAALLAQH